MTTRARARAAEIVAHTTVYFDWIINTLGFCGLARTKPQDCASISHKISARACQNRSNILEKHFRVIVRAWKIHKFHHGQRVLSGGGGREGRGEVPVRHGIRGRDSLVPIFPLSQLIRLTGKIRSVIKSFAQTNLSRDYSAICLLSARRCAHSQHDARFPARRALCVLPASHQQIFAGRYDQVDIRVTWASNGKAVGTAIFLRQYPLGYPFTRRHVTALTTPRSRRVALRCVCDCPGSCDRTLGRVFRARINRNPITSLA